MTSRELPVPLDTVTVPYFLSPSRYNELLVCPLRALARPIMVTGSLPPTPESLVGLLFHHVRDQVMRGRWGETGDALEAARTVVREAEAQLDECLSGFHQTERMAPIRETVGRTRWNSLLYELSQWSSTLAGGSSESRPENLQCAMDEADTDSASSQSEHGDHLEFGPESWVVCNQLRLRGRVDRAADEGGFIGIYEYKSGTILDDSGELLDNHVLQLRLYALAFHIVSAGRPIELFIEGEGKTPVPWNDEVRDACLEGLQETLRRFPAGSSFRADALAQPGTVCIGCRLRPRCSSYLDRAPAWWHNRPDSPRPLPLDVWGTIRSKLPEDNDSVALELDDAAGRRVRVQGLDAATVEHLKPGDTTYFFTLESTEPTIMHGVRLQPRNFHEYFPNADHTLRQARQMQVYKASTAN